MLTRQWLMIGGAFLTLATYSSAAGAPFYQGKTLTVIQGRTPGGTGDLRTRTVIQHLKRFLPGNPTIVSQYMPGGGGTLAANHLANVAKRDGLTIGNFGSTMFAKAILGARGVRYKLNDFVFLGSASLWGPNTIIIRPGLGLDTVEKVRAYKGLRFAQRSVGHSLYIIDRMVAYILEFKDPRWVLGYSSPEVYLALERKEADVQSNSIPTLLRVRPKWLKEGFTFPIVIRNTKGRGAEVVPSFPQDRPNLEQFADTALKRDVLRFHNASRPASGPYVVHRGIPETALNALQTAFNKIWKDSQFAGDYERMTGAPADPMTGKEIKQALQQIPKDPKVMELFKRLIGPGPLP